MMADLSGQEAPSEKGEAMTVRKRFEAWLRERGYVLAYRKPGTPHSPPAIEHLWQAWSGGYDAGIDDMETGWVDDGGEAEAESVTERFGTE